jgi:hypothetical protein
VMYVFEHYQPDISRRRVEKRFIKIRDRQSKGQAAKCMRTFLPW